VRKILRDTAWTGTDGKVTHGIDAHAALLRVMDGKLPDEFEEWSVGSNDSAEKAAPLVPLLGNPNRLGPIGGIATHNKGDHDWWRFTLTTIRDVEIRLEWYERLGTLNLHAEPADPEEQSVESVTKIASMAGTVVLSGILGPGTYRLRVTGSAISAYEIGVTLRRAVLEPDRFEPNQSFETAAPLLFHASQRMFHTVLGRRWWGPGTFDGTLHALPIPIGPAWELRIDADYYLLDGRVETENLFRFCDVYGADEPIDITLYDSDHHLMRIFEDVRSASIRLDKPEIHYLELRSLKPTRYKISTYMMVDPRVLAEDIGYVEVLPEWWGKSPFVKVDDNPLYYLVTIGSGEHDLNPAFERGLALRDLSDRAKIALVDTLGNVIREATVVAEAVNTDGVTHELTIDELPPGAYYLRVTALAERETGKNSAILLLPPVRRS